MKLVSLTPYTFPHAPLLLYLTVGK